jgi:hypothetical protein
VRQIGLGREVPLVFHSAASEEGAFGFEFQAPQGFASLDWRVAGTELRNLGERGIVVDHLRVVVVLLNVVPQLQGRLVQLHVALVALCKGCSLHYWEYIWPESFELFYEILIIIFFIKSCFIKIFLNFCKRSKQMILTENVACNLD